MFSAKSPIVEKFFHLGLLGGRALHARGNQGHQVPVLMMGHRDHLKTTMTVMTMTCWRWCGQRKMMVSGDDDFVDGGDGDVVGDYSGVAHLPALHGLSVHGRHAHGFHHRGQRLSWGGEPVRGAAVLRLVQVPLHVPAAGESLGWRRIKLGSQQVVISNLFFLTRILPCHRRGTCESLCVCVGGVEGCPGAWTACHTRRRSSGRSHRCSEPSARSQRGPAAVREVCKSGQFWFSVEANLPVGRDWLEGADDGAKVIQSLVVFCKEGGCNLADDADGCDDGCSFDYGFVSHRSRCKYV